MVFDPDIFNNYLNNYWFQSSIFFIGVYKASTIFACSTYKQDSKIPGLHIPSNSIYWFTTSTPEKVEKSKLLLLCKKGLI